MNLNGHFVSDGVFVEDGQGCAFDMLPVPANANVLTILDRIMPDAAKREHANAG